MASWGRVERARLLTLDHLARLLLRHGFWNRLEKGSCVGMCGVLEEVRGGSYLDDSSEMHDRHAIAGMLHDAKIMSDEEVGQVELLLQVH